MQTWSYPNIRHDLLEDGKSCSTISSVGTGNISHWPLRIISWPGPVRNLNDRWWRRARCVACKIPTSTLQNNPIAAGMPIRTRQRPLAQCLQCHNGPLFTNRGFHNVGTGGLTGEHLDFGRMVGIQAVLQDEFNCLGIYSDAEPEDCHSLRFLNKSAHMPVQGAFKTPSLRNLLQTAPYFHDGRFSTLKQVIEFYNNPPQVERNELRPLNLSKQEMDQLTSFLRTLSSP